LIIPKGSGLKLKSIFAQRTSYTFGYTYPQQMVVTCTQPGTTTFTIATGKTLTPIKCSVFCQITLPPEIVSVTPAQVTVPGVTATPRFQVTDSYGNGISGVTVNVTTDGNGLSGFNFCSNE
jgi:hypothetical protein